MTKPSLPLGEGDVPDKVLQELLAAFAKDDLNKITVPVEQVEADIELETGPHDAAESAPAPQPMVEPQGPVFSVPPKKVIHIAGSDLPDAVYLDEEGEERLRGTSPRSTEKSSPQGRVTILISGDDVEGESGGIPIATGPATMDPRVRARRIAVKRAIGRRRLRWVAIATVVIIVIVAALALLGSSLFAVRNVSVSGVRRAQPGLIDAVVADLTGTPTVLVDTEKVTTRLEQDPWVSRARVSTDFPHGASIEIVERIPLATYAANDGRFRIVDAEGKVVAVEQNRPIEFMLILGGGAQVEPGAFAGQGVSYAAQLVEALSPAMRSRTQAVVVSDKDELTLLFYTGATVVFGGPTDLLQKLVRLEAVLNQPGADDFVLINVSTAEISTK